MKKLLLFLITLLASTIYLVDVKADSIDNYYYIASKWVGNSENTGNNQYYVGLFNELPDVNSDYTISNNSNITYYRFSSYEKMEAFLLNFNESLADVKTTNKKSMMLNSDPSYFYYSNFDMYLNGKLYFPTTLYDQEYLVEDSYTWGGYDEVSIKFNTNQVDVINKNGSISTTIIEHPYFFIYWQDSSIDVVQSDSDITLYPEQLSNGSTWYRYYSNYPDSTGIYLSSYALDKESFKNYIDYGGYFTVYRQTYQEWNQFFTNFDVYMSDGTLYAKSNLITSYEYEGIIETPDKSKIEINFSIPENETFSFDLELLTQFSDIYLSKPYLEYTDIYDNTTISQIDDFLGEREQVEATDLEGNELYQYSGTFGIDFNELKTLKIVFDVSNYTNDLYLKFTSSINYSIDYIYTIDDTGYYQTIMMNDKYGIYLIPKTTTSDNFSTINLAGKYNIEVRNNYNGFEQYDVLETYIEYIDPNFQYKYTFNNLNYLIYFENTEYNTDADDSYYITFDTRYYNYSIKKFIYDSPTITNPNTNEDIIIDSNDVIVNELDNSIDDYIFSAVQFIDDVKEFIKIPVVLFSYFFNLLNGHIQMAIITIFIILVVFGLIAIIIKK